MSDNNYFGVLSPLVSGLQLHQQIALARRNFANAPHGGLEGRVPVHARFHPNDLPQNVLEIGGLLVLSDDTVRPGYVRITTATFTEEFVAERQYIDRRLRAALA